MSTFDSLLGCPLSWRLWVRLLDQELMRGPLYQRQLLGDFGWAAEVAMEYGAGCPTQRPCFRKRSLRRWQRACVARDFLGLTHRCCGEFGAAEMPMQTTTSVRLVQALSHF